MTHAVCVCVYCTCLFLHYIHISMCVHACYIVITYIAMAHTLCVCTCIFITYIAMAHTPCVCVRVYIYVCIYIYITVYVYTDMHACVTHMH